MPIIIKLNEDDLREIFYNRPPHFSSPERGRPESIALYFSDQNESEIELLPHRVTDARRVWGKVSFDMMDKVRKYTSVKPNKRKVRNELIAELTQTNCRDDAENLMRWAVSCSVFTNKQLQEIEDDRPTPIEYTAPQLARKQGMNSDEEITARQNLIYRWWKQSRDTGSENPEEYLKTRVAESSIEQLEKMFREDASIADMARECGATNKTIANYFNALTPNRRAYLFKNRSQPL